MEWRKFVSDHTNRSDDAILYKSDIRNDTYFEFIVNMLYNNEVVGKKEINR